MKIRFENTVEDLVLFNRYHWDHSPRSRRTKRWLLAVPLLLVLGPAIGVGLWVQIPWFYLLAGAVVLSALYLTFAPGAFNRALDRQIRWMYSGQAGVTLIGEHELELTATELIERADEEESSMELSAIDRVASTATHTWIYLTSVQAIIIPRLGILEGDYDGFVTTLATTVTQRKAESVTAEPH